MVLFFVFPSVSSFHALQRRGGGDRHAGRPGRQSGAGEPCQHLRVTDKLVLRSLITSDKQEIIDIARRIGTEEFSRHVPEYCWVPTTRASLPRIEAQGALFNFEVLEMAIQNIEIQWDVGGKERLNRELALAAVSCCVRMYSLNCVIPMGRE